MNINKDSVEEARELIKQNPDLEYDYTYPKGDLKITYEQFLFIALWDCVESLSTEAREIEASYNQFLIFDEDKEDEMGLYESILLYLDSVCVRG